MEIKEKIGALTKVVAVSSVLYAMPVVSESELDYALGMSLGIRDIEFDFTSKPLTIVDFGGEDSEKVDLDLEETLYTAGFWGTLFYDRFHITGMVELTPEEEDTSVSAPLFSISGDLVQSERQSELDRFDASVTFGFQVWRGLSLFGGYKYTEFTFDALEDATVLQNKDTSYEEEGLFAGATYSFHYGEKGSLSISFAYAYLDVDYSEDNAYQTNQPIKLGELAYNSTAKGLSYGAAWSGPLTDNWIYNVGLKFQSYEADSVTAIIDAEGFPDGLVALEDLETEHSDTVFSVGVQYIFQ